LLTDWLPLSFDNYQDGSKTRIKEDQQWPSNVGHRNFKEAKDGGTDLNFVSVAQHVFAKNPSTVNESPVSTQEIFHKPSSVDMCQHALAPATRCIADHNVIFGMPTDARMVAMGEIK
jgi:hypothetical protein